MAHLCIFYIILVVGISPKDQGCKKNIHLFKKNIDDKLYYRQFRKKKTNILYILEFVNEQIIKGKKNFAQYSSFSSVNVYLT